MIINLTHDRAIPWLVPSLEPTFATITFPLVAIVIFEGDLISHERIYWDQATVLKQLGVIDASISDVTGPEQASLLPSNKLLGEFHSSSSFPPLTPSEPSTPQVRECKRSELAKRGRSQHHFKPFVFPSHDRK